LLARSLIAGLLLSQTCRFVLSYRSSGAPIKPGMFIEDVLGQQMRAELRQHGEPCIMSKKLRNAS
jgi:hypothetical protein